MTSVSHFAFPDGSYAGAFDDLAAAPTGALAVPSAPRRATDIWDGTTWLDGSPTPEMVTAERDRRLRGLATFQGHAFQIDEMSLIRIAGAASLAQGAIVAGASAGDLQWHGGDSDFTWTAADNTDVPMDAQTMFLFGQMVAIREAAHVQAARVLKGLSPIPSDYTHNTYWPS